LPESYRNILESAALEANNWCLAKYDAENPDALRRVVAQGAQLKAFPKDVLDTAYRIAFQHYAEIAAQNPKFKKIHDHWLAFREKELQWFRIGEAPFDFFIYSQRN
jgi:TRAP-type mannitol/chloroaromatic compound transport system substrate-binding protein